MGQPKRRLATVRRWQEERGAAWTALTVTHRAVRTAVRRLEQRILDLEHKRGITGRDTLSSAGNTYQQNRDLWSGWDWSEGGEEWTADVEKFLGLDPAQWKARLTAEVLEPNIGEGDVVLEIGPGAGRWSEVLATRASRLLLADISQTCLDLCRDRFGADPRVEYVLVGPDGRLDIDDASVDSVWSYDVFVHVNPSDTERYLSEFARVLRPGGRATIHHSGKFIRTDKGFRSHMDADLFRRLAERHGLEVVSQDDAHVHKKNDVISVLVRPER